MGGGGGGKTYNMPLYASFSCGAFSTSFAEVRMSSMKFFASVSCSARAYAAYGALALQLCTIPLDTAKVRLQLQAGAKATGPLKYNG
eukprot:scaffold2643_cov387-Prasinococcus_capsulatus_cf.AAC.4